MPEQLTPYDDGYRLEPRPWVAGTATVSNRTAQAVSPDHYGRVDFDNEDSETVLTAWVQKTETGYILRVDEHTASNLTIETSTDRQRRETAMQKLDTELRLLGFEDGEPEAFGRGNYEYVPPGGTYRIFVNEQFVGTDLSDPDRVPNSWQLDAEQYENGDWMLAEELTADDTDIDRLIDKASSLVQFVERETAASNWPHAQAGPQHHTSQHGPLQSPTTNA